MEKEDEQPLIDNDNRQSGSKVTDSQDIKNHAMSTNWQVLTNLLKTSFGISVLVLPYAYMVLGLLLSYLLFFGFGIMYYYGAYSLSTLANKHFRNTKSYSDFLYLALGNYWGHFGRFIIIVVQSGICITYLTGYLMFFQTLFCFRPEFQHLCAYKAYSLLAVALSTLPLAFITKFHRFYMISLCGNIAVSFCLLYLLGYAISVFVINNLQQVDDFQQQLDKTNMFRIDNLHKAIGVIMFCYKSNAILFELRFSTQNLDQFTTILKQFVIVIFVIFSSFPTIMSFGFQQKTHQFILLSMPITETMPLIVMCTWMLNIAITFPIHFMPVLDQGDNIVRAYRNRYWKYDNLEQQNNCRKYKVARFTLRSFFVLIVYLVAYKVPEISAFVGLVGSIGLGFMNFLFPIMSYHALETEISNTRKTVHIIYVLILLVSMGLGLYNSINKLLI